MTLRHYRGKGVRLLCDVVREPGTASEAGRLIQHASHAAELVRELQRLGRWPTDREAFGSILLDSRHRVLAAQIVSIGTLTAACVHPRELFRGAIVAGAHAVIVAHNHPSGDVAPSDDDRLVTERLQQAGELLGVEVLDHVVVGASAHFSFASRAIEPCGT